MAGARYHTDPEAWKLANELRTKTQALVKSPEFSRYVSLRMQIDKATQSVCANIAEGFGRYQPRDFARFLRIAKGSLLEVQEHLHQARGLDLLNMTDADESERLTRRAIGAIVKLVRYLETAKAP